MKISLTMPDTSAVTTHGYGVAGFGMVRTLQDLGHEVPFKDPTAPVEVAFSQPVYWEWSNPKAYHIGYVPWESTKLPESWIEPMKAADEIWTTSAWCKRVFERHGLTNVRVYMHGIDALVWERKRRRPKDRPVGTRQLRFLHMGEPAPRKGGQLVFDTFKETFGDSEDVMLTIKAHDYNTVRGKNSQNVNVLTAEVDTFDLTQIVLRHDVLLYPSYGEGFGLIPLQAMVTGMPTVCTGVWAPYKDLLIPELTLPSKAVPSPWPDVHPGNMYEPDVDALRAAMLTLADPAEYQNFSARAYFNSFQVEQAFDWHKLTRDAFAHIVEKFS